MGAIAKSTGSRLVPALRYRDISAAIDWLCGAFGFERHDVVTAVDGTILHARLMFGSDTILLLPVRNPDPAVARPAEEIGNEMQSCYFVVDDADEHYLNAKEAGAEVIDITEYDLGGRGYSCRDPEGHIWNFVTYDSPLTQATSDDSPKLTPYEPMDASKLRLGTAASFKSMGSKITRPVVFATVAGTVVAAAIVGLRLVTLPQSLPNGQESELAFRASASLQPAKRTAEHIGSQVAGRTHVDRLPVEEIAEARRTEPASERTDQQPAEPTRLYSTAFSTIGASKRDDGSERTVRQTNEPAPKAAAEQIPEEAPRQMRAVQAGTAEPALAPAEARVEETRKQVARALPEVREQQLEPARLAQEQKGDSQLWDCQPRPTGKVVCRLLGKKPAAAEATAPAPPKSKITAAQPSNVPSTQPQARSADSQLWDCQPKPPTGEVVCRPIGAAP